MPFHLTSPNPTVKLIYRVKLFVVRPRKEKKKEWRNSTETNTHVHLNCASLVAPFSPCRIASFAWVTYSEFVVYLPLSLFPCNLFVCLHIFTETEKAPSRREKLFLSLSLSSAASDVLAKRRKHIFVYDSLRHRNSLFLLKLRAPEEKCERFFFFHIETRSSFDSAIIYPVECFWFFLVKTLCDWSQL